MAAAATAASDPYDVSPPLHYEGKRPQAVPAPAVDDYNAVNVQDPGYYAGRVQPRPGVPGGYYSGPPAAPHDKHKAPPSEPVDGQLNDSVPGYYSGGPAAKHGTGGHGSSAAPKESGFFASWRPAQESVNPVRSSSPSVALAGGGGEESRTPSHRRSATMAAATVAADPPGYFVGRPVHYEEPQPQAAPPPAPAPAPAPAVDDHKAVNAQVPGYYAGRVQPKLGDGTVNNNNNNNNKAEAAVEQNPEPGCLAKLFGCFSGSSGNAN